MQYKVYIQDNLVGMVEANNTGNALAIVATKIKDKEFNIPDPNQSPNIRVEPSDSV